MAYYSIEPWGPERADLNAGIIASTLANINRDPKRGKSFSPHDFMPKYGEEPEADDGMAPERVMAVMEDFMRAQEKREKIERKVRN